MPHDTTNARDDDQTWAVLTALRDDVPMAVLIGGWATWLRTRGPMSHDIDLIVDHTDLARITEIADDMGESRHFAGRKWRGSIRDVHVGLYVPFESILGSRLKVRVEHLLPHTESIQGWRVLSKPAHFVTKLAALLDRADSLPGQKDRRELLALLSSSVDHVQVVDILNDASELPATDVADLLEEAFGYLAEDVENSKARRELRSTLATWLAHSTADGR